MASRFTQLSATIAVSLGFAAPIQAERLVFEGTFATYVECGFIPNECSDRTVDIPFSFAVDLTVGMGGATRHESSTQFSAPSLTPSIVMDPFVPYGLTAETFYSMAGHNRLITVGYTLSGFAGAVGWDFQAFGMWGGFRENSVPPHSLIFAEELFMTIPLDPARFNRVDVSFAELVGFFDEAMAARQVVEVHARGGIFRGEIENPRGDAFEASTELTGSFRIVAVQCRTPTGMLGRLRSGWPG